MNFINSIPKIINVNLMHINIIIITTLVLELGLAFISIGVSIKDASQEHIAPLGRQKARLNMSFTSSIPKNININIMHINIIIITTLVVEIPSPGPTFLHTHEPETMSVAPDRLYAKRCEGLWEGSMANYYL